MNAPDFAAILGSRRLPYFGGTIAIGGGGAAELLDAKVPELCPTCNGSGWRWFQTPEMHGPQGLPCPDCPTIGRLLAIGAAAWTAHPDEWSAEANVCLSILRAVRR